MATVWQDVRYALRTMRRTPAFTAVASGLGSDGKHAPPLPRTWYDLVAPAVPPSRRRRSPPSRVDPVEALRYD